VENTISAGPTWCASYTFSDRKVC